MNRFVLFFPLLLIQGLSAQQMSWITTCADKSFCLNQNSCAQGEVFLVEKAVTKDLGSLREKGCQALKGTECVPPKKEEEKKVEEPVKTN